MHFEKVTFTFSKAQKTRAYQLFYFTSKNTFGEILVKLDLKVGLYFLQRIN